MGNACGAGSNGAVSEQRAKEGAAEKMCKRRGSSVVTDRNRSRSRGGARGGDGVRRCPPACGPTQIPPFPARSALR